MTQLIAVLGSVTPPGRLRAAVSEGLERAAAGRAEVVLLDLANLRLDFADGRAPSEHADDSAKVIQEVTQAQAVLFASPVYRGSYTGALKNFLDLLPVESLCGKPCGIVAMGAGLHHYLGVDWQLRQVLSWFGAFLAPTSVYLASDDFSEGKPNPAANEAIDELVAALLRLASVNLGDGLGPPPLGGRRA